MSNPDPAGSIAAAAHAADAAEAVYLPLSALNDLLFCQRRCALHRIENVWVDNLFTLEGTHAHQRADKEAHLEVRGVRAVHAILLKCDRLRLTGKADVIEFHKQDSGTGGQDSGVREQDSGVGSQDSGTEGPSLSRIQYPASSIQHPATSVQHASSIEYPTHIQHPASSIQHLASTQPPPQIATPTEIPFPVEYKRGKRRRWDNDDVQLCAQALCLEEMLGVAVPAGAVFHIKSKRRREIVFTPELRAKTEDAARRLHELVASGVTPPPVLKARCRGCSLHELCMPELMSQKRKIADYCRDLFVIT